VLLRSYANALSLGQSLRAYAYWEPAAAEQEVGPYPDFARGMARTKSVAIAFGPIGGDVGAGQLYWSVPASLTSTLDDGAVQWFVGCYTLHLARPEIQDAPPFHPLGIQSATVRAVATPAEAEAGVTTACQAIGRGQVGPGAPSLSGGPAGATPYLDDRSNPVAVLQSLANALNRTEYDRAYSYWDPGAAPAQLPPYAQFKEGYASTRSVEITTGAVASDAGAGQIFFAVPVVLHARLTDGTMQTFTGCYQLHLSQPSVQATPPFQPMAIRSAAIAAASGNPVPDATMAAACQG
jgi:hypothetical protein